MRTILSNPRINRLCRITISMAILIFFSHLSLYPQISGNKIIGPGGDYLNFTDAVNALNTLGINGPVVFNVISGTYVEQFVIQNIAGSSAVNHVIFQSQSGDSATVILQWAATKADSNFVVRIDGGKYITFRGITFKAMGSNYGKLMEMDGWTNDISILNSQFLGLDAGDATPTKTILKGDNKNLASIRIRNNRFVNGSHAIFLQGYNDKFIMESEVTGNVMINSGYAGIYMNWVYAPLVTGNIIESKNSGIQVLNELSNGFYSYNRIIAGRTGMRIQRIGTSILKAQIANNFISVISATGQYGIDLSNSIMTEVFYNSVYLNSKSNISAACYIASGTAMAGLVIQNNNFVNENTGYAVLATSPVAISTISHNNLYTAGNYIAKWGNVDVFNLNELQSVSGKNENSLAVFPHYTSENDLHTSAPWLDGKGIHIANISRDIDGEERDLVYTDIGADEFTPDPVYLTKLNGTYTIGSNGYYKDFASALNDALIRGISGPVIYNIQSGTYDEQVKIKSFPGSSSVNNITFRSETGNYTDVQISFTATSANDNYVISFYGSDFVRLENVSVLAYGGTYARVIELYEGCDSVVLENNYLAGKTVGDANTNAQIIYSDGSYFRSRIFKGNIINKGSYGMYMRMESQGDQHPRGCVIEENTISENGYTGISLQFYDTPLVRNNNISAKSTGISINTCHGPVKIIGNKISWVSQNGIILNSCTANTNDRGIISNNFIHGGGTGPVEGLSLNATIHYSVLHNSVNITSSYVEAKAFYLSSSNSSRVIIKNNIFFNKGGAYAYFVTAPVTIVESDYNDIYTLGGPLAYWGGNQSDLTALKTASGKDQHSISANPQFVSDTDLHTTASQLDSMATPVPEVRYDIDGRRRDLFFPDIGAVEFGPIANHAPIAMNDTATTTTRQRVAINVLANDSDTDGDNILIHNAANGRHGVVEIHPQGLELYYTSAAGFSGSDSFIYRIRDDFGLIDSAYVFVKVEPLPPFTLTDIKIIDLTHGSVAWGDYDNDGDLDILITGWLGTSHNYASRIYQNNNGVFTDSGILLAGLSPGTSHSAEWMDIDNDNDLDIIISGGEDGNPLSYKSIIYENTDGKFVESAQEALPDVTSGSVDWADFNHDGKVDLLISGNRGGGNYLTEILENTGPDHSGNWKMKRYDAEFTGIWSGESMWVDFDGDGDMDVFVCGFGAEPSELYRNIDGVFTALHTNLPALGNAACHWGDYDNDRDMDLVLMGRLGTDYLTKIFRNDGFVGKVYTFTDIMANLVQVESGDAAWGDFDNDGDLDLVITGNTSLLTSVTKLYENKNGEFVEVNTPFYDMGRSTLAWGDYDGDGDLDLIIAGFSPSLLRPVTAVYRNNHNLPGKIPSSPVKLNSAFQEDGSVLFSWERPDEGFGKYIGPLTYNLRIGTEPGGTDILSPLAKPKGGLRKVVKNGNTGISESWMLTGFELGKTYYWSVQALDMAYRGSEFAEEQLLQVVNIPVQDSPELLRIFPNPASDQITVSIPEGMFTSNSIRVRIIDASGKFVYFDKYLDGSGSNLLLDINALDNGVYMLELSAKNAAQRLRFVKIN